MAFRTNSSSGRTYNSSASGSQSPASETSSNTSPSSRTSQLPMKKEGDAQSSGSGRGTPNRTRIDLPRNISAAKGGCWTCRLRRKKCDEQRQEEGGACETCRRLQIECLGWGPKRPEWMKDKKAQDEYKAKIKATLLSNNMIRGQPRTTVQANAQTNAQPLSSPPVVPSQQLRPSRTTSSSRPAPSSNANNQGLEYRYNEMRHSRQNSSTAPQNAHRRSYHGSSQTNFEPTATPSSNYFSLPTASYSDPSLATIDLQPSFSPPTFTPPSLSAPEPTTFDPLSFVGPSFQYDPQPQTFSGQNSVTQEHVLYYFEHVRKMQFIFASNNVTNITYAIILQEPQGPVTSAVCALASLHHERMRVAQGLESHESSPDNSYALYFYNEAWSRITSSKQSRGHYTVTDAIAALHLVSYSTLSRGSTDWRSMLEVACEWLGQSGISVNENPKYMLSTMTNAETFALKTTMWYDIVSSVTLLRPPRYLGLYRRLFGSISGYWPCAGPNSDDGYDLRMDSLAGCPDEVMLGIAEVSALAHWKAQEQQNGCLSMRELIRRGDAIEQQLRAHTGPDYFLDIDQAPLHPSLPGAAGVDFNSVSPTMHTSLSSPRSPHTIVPFPTEEMRRVVASIFREAVLLYLHMVLSDPVPGVPEINASVDTVIQLFSQLPSSEVDRSLVLPLCLAGCLTNDRARRDLLKARLQAQDENIGNILQVRGLMEAVWRQRDYNGAVVDWRDIMRNDGLNVLLI